ncbi:MAG TPA: SAM-dependent methyltransferase [Desulfotomaculum sp.]|nr:SAM-dependent methyltransferase [Desulfotomaculum sp.]HBY04251.1 SAM-dependent methyltransferase [Desulfotomaculum sp.]
MAVCICVEGETALKKRGTITSSFGSPGRRSHDSKPFYSSRLFEEIRGAKGVAYIENPVPVENLNRIFCKTSENMEEIPDYSVHLAVTSPPYNTGKDYDEDLNLSQYRSFLLKVWKEVYRVLVPGGRICVNIANLGRKPYIPIHAFEIEDIQSAGFFMRGEIIWNKAGSASRSTAWGSWLSAANPTLRDVHEYILVFSKEVFSRKAPAERKSTITREQFLEYTKSIWTFPAEQAKKIGHPAPFPVELPYRLIQLYTFQNEIILDPFMGSGQTAIAALKAQRNYIGYETDSSYVQLASKRIGDWASAQE